MTPDGRGRLHQNGAPSQTYRPPLVVAAPERLERSKGRGDVADRSRALGAPSRARLPPRTPGRDHIQIPNSVDGHGQDSFPTPAGTDTVRSADVRLLRSGALDVVVVGAGEHLGGAGLSPLSASQPVRVPRNLARNASGSHPPDTTAPRYFRDRKDFTDASENADGWGFAT